MVRLSCLDCVRKHISQAIVLLCEVAYPLHQWLAIGHLAEAEAECGSYNELRDSIRATRLLVMAGEEVGNMLMLLLQEAVDCE